MHISLSQLILFRLCLMTRWRPCNLLALHLGLLVVALLRRRCRRGVGAQLAYGLWLLPPGLALAAALPAPDSLRITLPSLQIDASGLAVAASGAPERAFVVQGAR